MLAIENVIFVGRDTSLQTEVLKTLAGFGIAASSTCLTARKAKTVAQCMMHQASTLFVVDAALTDGIET